MKYQQEITLELNSNTAYITVGAKQGDSYTREILVHITADGVPWVIPSGTVASYRIRKPDGTAVWNSAHIENNNVLFTLSGDTLAVAGRAYADIVFYKNANKSEILSTVSFIIIIMSSPNISKEVISSNEFGYISQVVSDAEVIIDESESWAVGTRKGVPVLGDKFVSEITTGSGFTYTINESDFREYVGISPGQTIVWTLTYISNLDGWILSSDNYPAEQVRADEIGLIINGIPSPGSVITVTISDSALQWQNNAKYWSDTAKNSRDSIENLEAEVVETLNYTEPASVNRLIENDITVISQPSGYNITINNEDIFINAINNKIDNYIFYYQNSNWFLDGNKINLNDYSITGISQNPIDGDIFIINYNTHVKLGFSIPRGYTGDTNFMTLAIDPATGILYMYRPANLVDKINFSIDEDNGFLQVEMETEDEV